MITNSDASAHSRTSRRRRVSARRVRAWARGGRRAPEPAGRLVLAERLDVPVADRDVAERCFVLWLVDRAVVDRAAVERAVVDRAVLDRVGGVVVERAVLG